ncbi:NADH dehydrogenase subunit H [Panacagrimonas perspica]|uniref:NADH-quinone oxidoreductase subunit H n=1 Tax=Panacagrimonas perspica TaxID=381431 RepID=A0A4S3K2V7_9GAMM|nr:NADH-quinone oxidoreductase subunit NuoH [Panacagrimonas perspica]TDU28817.1 NADH dehydrogenase subunit H [Panacagrimonas perspica]THD02350.1 NADH-quinone oxidoreductase subunit H [Panacagrimonas perspica]
MTLPSWITQETIDTAIKSVQAVVILVGMVVVSAWMIWLERRLLALWQDRYGPNRVGPFGLGQVIADMLKIFFKEDWTPPFADKAMFWIAPAIAMAMMILGFMIIPLGDTLWIADLNIGLLFFLAIAGLAVYAVILGGWASNSKYSLLGGVRSTAQTISYEVFMGISLMGVVMQAGSFNLREIVHAQQEQVWFVVTQLLGFIVWVPAALAVTHRTPFDLPEAEQELVQGYHTEYSSMKFGMFMVSEYVGIVMVSALTTTLFFGGWDVPFVDNEGWFLSFLSFSAKTFIFMCSYILVRAALPRPRYDQIMAAGWKVCLPISLINMLGTAAVILWQTPGASS